MTFLTELSLKRASVALLIAIGMVIGGVYGALNLNQELTPDIDFPLITVITAYPGALPEDVASEVSAPLEGAVSSIPGLKSLQSVSAEGVSIVIAQFDFGQDMKAAEQEILRNLSSARLPSGTQTPQVARLNINQTLPVVMLSLGGEIGAEELERLAYQELVPRIKAVEGVQSVDVIGGVSRQIEVVLDPEKMRDVGITMQQVSGVLKASNISIPTGAIETDGVVLPLRTVSQLTSLTEIENVVVGLSPGEGAPGPVQLKEIAQVRVTSFPAGGISRTNGKPSIALAVTKTQQGNTVKVASAVKDIAREVERKLGGRGEVSVIFDQSTSIVESLTGLTREGLYGAIAAVFAIWVFLLSFRSTLVAGVSIPLSVLVALLVLYLRGFTLNILTLAGLTIAIGRVVDDSIVVLENIYRHVQEGEDLDKAVRSAPREVATAIFGATLTTVAVFLPLGFTGGIVGVLFRPFALTVTFALLASLVVALTVVPLLARFFVKRRQLERREPARSHTLVQRGYTPVLSWALRHRVWTLAIAALLFLVSFALFPLIPTTFLPQFGEKEFMVSVSLPPGSGTPQETLAKAMEAEKVIAGLPGVETYNTSITLGAGGGNVMALGRAVMGLGTQGATITVRLRPEADLEGVQELARERLGSLEGVLTSVGGGGPDAMNTQLQVSVVGQDAEAVRAAALQVLQSMKEVPGVRDVSSAALGSMPEIAIKVDPQKALGVGLTAAQVAQQVRELTAGQTVTRVRLDNGESLDLVLRADPRFVGNLDALRNLPVGGSKTVPLSSVATIEETLAPSLVTRLDQRASATISGTITAANTGKVNREVQQRISALSLPPGVEMEYGGVLQQFQEGFNALFVSIGIAIIVVYIVMVLVMGSLLSPFIIMFSLPLTSIGALAALAITGRALSLPALFGMLMLVGIVVTNAIVLIDFVNQLRKKGYSVHDALMEGGRLRVRPVIMTAVATILALIPMSLGFTKGAIIAAELATVVIGGLFTSTLLTLVVVPVVYSIFEGFRQRLSREPVVEKPAP